MNREPIASERVWSRLTYSDTPGAAAAMAATEAALRVAARTAGETSRPEDPHLLAAQERIQAYYSHLGRLSATTEVEM